MRARQTNSNSPNVSVVRSFMSDSVELVSAFRNDRRAERIEAALAAVAHPDFALVDRASPEFAGRAIPIHGYVEAWRRFLECWEWLQLDVEQLVEHRSHVVVISRVRGRSKVAGILLEDRRAAVWTFRRGRVRRIEQYATPTEALEAAGLCVAEPSVMPTPDCTPSPEPSIASLPAREWARSSVLLAMAENARA
jgi:ketosteroid isomerase-like protein